MDRKIIKFDPSDKQKGKSELLKNLMKDLSESFEKVYPNKKFILKVICYPAQQDDVLNLVDRIGYEFEFFK